MRLKLRLGVSLFALRFVEPPCKGGGYRASEALAFALRIEQQLCELPLCGNGCRASELVENALRVEWICRAGLAGLRLMSKRGNRPRAANRTAIVRVAALRQRLSSKLAEGNRSVLDKSLNMSAELNAANTRAA